MADLADVSNTLKAVLTAAVYPTGTGNPSAIPGGAPCALMRGWPIKEQLQTNLAAAIVTVSIYALPGMERNVTRFPRDWQVMTPPATTITAAIAGHVITLGGTVSTPQNIAVKANGLAFTYAIQAGDTLTTIATALAALINAHTQATSSGPTITIPNGVGLTVMVGGQGTIWRELRRQERLFQISVWCSTPEQRDVAAPFIDGVLAGAGLPNAREFLALPDGTSGRLLYARTSEVDKDQLVGSFRRDFIYSVEYPTIETQAATEIVTIAVNFSADAGEAGAIAPTTTINL